MKRGPLSNQDKQYITEHKDNCSVADMATELDRSEKIVEKFLGELPKPKPRSKAGRFLARNTEYGTVSMTESASMEGDSNKRAPRQPERYKNIIHKIREE